MSRISRKAADAIVRASEFEALLDGEYERNELGHVYGLEDGSAVVVTFDGELSSPDRPTMTLERVRPPMWMVRDLVDQLFFLGDETGDTDD